MGTRRQPRRRGPSLGAALAIALQGLSRNKTRAFLATLGIIIGVGCVITMMALGEGARLQMEEQIRRLGTNTLMVRPGEQRTGAVRLGRDSGMALTLEDSAAVADECPAVELAAPRVTGSAQVKHGNVNWRTTVGGTTGDFFPVRNYPLASGRVFVQWEIDARARVAVLGSEVARRLYEDHDPVGERIYIRGQPFQVIGLLEARGGGDTDWDDRVWVPVTTAMDRIFGQDYIGLIDVKAVDEASLDPAQAQIEAVLRQRHRLREGQPNDFEIRNQADLLESISETSAVLTALLAGIASVSLLVGGIGIMNIMLVSVIERTREIGIRRAIGARRSDILVQFLIESLAMCALGAALGIAAGYAACWVGAVYAGWPIALSVPSLILSSGFAVAIGIFFGLYPAMRAAGLSPLSALRYD